MLSPYIYLNQCDITGPKFKDDKLIFQDSYVIKEQKIFISVVLIVFLTNFWFRYQAGGKSI